MQRLSTCAAVFVLAGCATTASIFNDCDAKSRQFSEVAECTVAALKADTRYSFHKGYQASANRAIAALNYLDESVSNGTLTERQARYQAQEVLASIRAQERADFEASKVNNPAFQPQPQPRKATCTTNGGISTCNIK